MNLVVINRHSQYSIGKPPKQTHLLVVVTVVVIVFPKEFSDLGSYGFLTNEADSSVVASDSGERADPKLQVQ